VHPEQYCLFDLGRVDFSALKRKKERTMKCQKARNTMRAYTSAWKIFREWCEEGGRDPLPATLDTIGNFAVHTLDVEGLRLQTIKLRLKAIGHYHREANLPSMVNHEDVREYLRCATRERKETPGGKAPVTPEQIRRIVRLECETPAQIRNRAMLLVAFASGWRRSEVVALDYGDLDFAPKQGMGLTLRFSKVDQEAKGRYVGIFFGDSQETCPVRALKAWLALRGDWQGPLFTRLERDCKTVTRERLNDRGDVLYQAVKDYMARIGEDAALYGAHSTRAGHVTAATEAGATIASIKLRTGHKDTKTMEKYIRIPTAFGSNPMAGVL
jgi:site-specific recombinase XerD